MSINNIVLTSIKECFDEKASNFLLGPWCENHESKKLHYDIKSYQNHHWSDKNKMLSDYEYLYFFYQELISLLSRELNNLHNLNEDKKYWELILGPWLFSMLPVIFDRWETLRIFFEQNPNINFQTTINKEKDLKFTYTTDVIRSFAYKDNFNLYLFGKIIKKFYKNIKFREIDTIVQQKRSKNYLNFRASFEIVKIISFFNKIQFDVKSMELKDFFRLCINLGSFPFVTGPLFSIFQNNFFNKNRKDINRNEIEKNIGNEFNKSFEKFCIHFLIDTMPECFLENFTEIKKEIDKFCSKKKIFFSNYSILNNDAYRIWVANSKKNYSKLIINTHGGFIPLKKNSFNYENSVSDKYLIWHKKTKFSNSFQFFPLKFSNNKEHNIAIKNKNRKKIGIIDLEFSKYSFRAVTWMSPTEYKHEKEETNKIFNNLIKHYYNNELTYRCMSDFGWNNVQDIRSFNDKINISSLNEESFNKFINRCFLTLHRYPSTPYSECLFKNVPSLLFFKKNSWIFDDRYESLLRELKNNKIYYNDVEDLCNFMKQDKNKIIDWWYSKHIQDFRLVLLDELCKKPKNWLKDFKKAIYS